MAQINIDTEKFKDSCKIIKTNLDEYQENIQNLFNNLESIKECWHGEDANEFIEIINDLKRKYFQIYDIILDYYNLINSIPNNLIEDLM